MRKALVVLELSDSDVKSLKEAISEVITRYDSLGVELSDETINTLEILLKHL